MIADRGAADGDDNIAIPGAFQCPAQDIHIVGNTAKAAGFGGQAGQHRGQHDVIAGGYLVGQGIAARRDQFVAG